MTQGNSIKDEIKKEKGKFKSLSFTAKLGYIWDYYKFIILGIIIAVVAVAAFINSYIRTNYDTVCYIVVAEAKISNASTDDDILTTGLTKYLGIDGKKKRVDFDYSYSIVSDDYFDQTDVNVNINKIYTLASTASMDGYLTDKEYIDFFSTDKEAFLYDLRELLTAKEIDLIEDKLIYFTNGEGKSIPIAVDLSDAPVIKNSDLTLETPCYGVVVSSEHVDNATAFIRYAFGW